MKQITMILTAAGVLLLTQCQQSDNNQWEETISSSDSSAATHVYTPHSGNSDKERKFIRTADLKFKVKDVSKATENIESVTLKNSGFVTYTHLSSDVSHTNMTSVSKDSSLLTTYYTVTNTITIRVPNVTLDTTLKSIAQNIEFLDYRIIKAEDVALQILANQLTQKRNAGNEIPDNTKVKSSILADEHNIRKKEISDEARIANLSLNDKINFSTIQLMLYQDPAVRHQLIANEKSPDSYRPGLGNRLAESFRTGWDIIEHILVFITQFWAIILIAIAAYYLYKRYGHRMKGDKE